MILTIVLRSQSFFQIVRMPRGRKKVSITPDSDHAHSHSVITSLPVHDEELSQMMSLRQSYNELMGRAHIQPQIAKNHEQYTILQSERALRQRIKLSEKLRKRALQTDGT